MRKMVVTCYKVLYQQLPRKAKKSHSNLGNDSRFLGRIFTQDLSHKQWGHKHHYGGAHPKILALSQLHCSLVSSVDSHYVTGVRTTGLYEMIVGVLTTATSFSRCNPHVISFYGVMSTIKQNFRKKDSTSASSSWGDCNGSSIYFVCTST